MFYTTVASSILYESIDSGREILQFIYSNNQIQLPSVERIESKTEAGRITSMSQISFLEKCLDKPIKSISLLQ